MIKVFRNWIKNWNVRRGNERKHLLFFINVPNSLINGQISLAIYRRKRRNTRSRRAIALPERDPIRTLRTIIPVFGKQPDAIVAPRRGATHNMHGGATGGAGVYAEIDSQSDEDDDVDEDGERISSRRKRANIAPGSYADNSSSFATSSSSAAAAAGNNNILTAPLNTVANASYHSPMPNAEQSIALAKHANLRTTLRVDVSLLGE